MLGMLVLALAAALDTSLSRGKHAAQTGSAPLWRHAEGQDYAEVLVGTDGVAQPFAQLLAQPFALLEQLGQTNQSSQTNQTKPTEQLGQTNPTEQTNQTNPTEQLGQTEPTEQQLGQANQKEQLGQASAPGLAAVEVSELDAPPAAESHGHPGPPDHPDQHGPPGPAAWAPGGPEEQLAAAESLAENQGVTPHVKTGQVLHRDGGAPVNTRAMGLAENQGKRSDTPHVNSGGVQNRGGGAQVNRHNLAQIPRRRPLQVGDKVSFVVNLMGSPGSEHARRVPSRGTIGIVDKIDSAANGAVLYKVTFGPLTGSYMREELEWQAGAYDVLEVGTQVVAKLGVDRQRAQQDVFATVLGFPAGPPQGRPHDIYRIEITSDDGKGERTAYRSELTKSNLMPTMQAPGQSQRPNAASRLNDLLKLQTGSDVAT